MSAPRHPIEVRISIGAETWPDLLRALKNLIADAELYQAGQLHPYVWGGAGTAGHVEVELRDVSPEQYREELLAWLDTQPKAQP